MTTTWGDFKPTRGWEDIETNWGKFRRNYKNENATTQLKEKCNKQLDAKIQKHIDATLEHSMEKVDNIVSSYKSYKLNTALDFYIEKTIKNKIDSIINSLNQ